VREDANRRFHAAGRLIIGKPFGCSTQRFRGTVGQRGKQMANSVGVADQKTQSSLLSKGPELENTIPAQN